MAGRRKTLFGFEDLDKREEQKTRIEELRYDIEAKLRATIVNLGVRTRRLIQRFELSLIAQWLKCLGDVSRFAVERESIQTQIRAMLAVLQERHNKDLLENTRVNALAQMQYGHAMHSGSPQEVREQWMQKVQVCSEWMQRLTESLRFTGELLKDIEQISRELDLFSHHLLEFTQSLSQ